MSTLKAFVIQKVPAKQYYEWVLGENDTKLSWPITGSEARVISPFREREKTPSLSLNPTTGAWFDHGGQNEDGSPVCGNSIVSFHAKLYECQASEACEAIYHKFIRPIISLKKVRRWARNLRSTPQAINYLIHKRMLPEPFIEDYKLGFDGARFGFPILNEFGLCINIKWYNPLFKKRAGIPKMVNHKEEGEPRSFGSPPCLYPINAMREAHKRGFVVVCEGEWDALILNSLDIPAVTSTAGSKSWPADYTSMFRNLEVVICYDNDEAGEAGRKKVVKRLKRYARIIKKLEVPKKYGKDPLDWFTNCMRMRRTRGWMHAIEKAPVVLENSANYLDTVEAMVPLDKARRADKIGKMMLIKAVIAAKATDPLTLPKKYRITCEDPSADDACPLNKARGDFIAGELDVMSEQTIDLLHQTKAQVNNCLMLRHGFDPKSDAKPKLEVTEYASFEELRIQPTVDSGCNEHVVAQAFSYGLGLLPNQSYVFHGSAYPTQDKSTTKLLLDKATPAQTPADLFAMTPELREQLKVFKPAESTAKHVMQRMMSIAEWQSRNITKIRERPDLHIAIDLVFHSVGAFDFNGERVKRGMLDVMVMGDTRCGKGYVAEGLQKWYQVGEVASGENCTFAGLVGGTQQIGKQWFVTWGIIPMNHNKCVIIDEASAIPENGGFNRLSRVRSEGVAEITKIARESAPAMTRLLWLANPVTGRPILSYSSGVHAIKELVGANEDISRFDYACTVATDEVESSIINEVKRKDETQDIEKYPRELSKQLVMWAWSRKPEQIRFTVKAVSSCIKTAIEFGKQYSSSIPLVQAENVRLKIAKVAAAIAARVFSCDEDGEVLIVDECHILAAGMFLRQLYSKPSMAYDVFSRNDKEDTKMDDPTKLDKLMDQLGEHKDETIKYLIRNALFTSDGLKDILPDDAAKELIRSLVVAKCIIRSSTQAWYMRSRDFTTWLRAKRKDL